MVWTGFIIRAKIAVGQVDFPPAIQAYQSFL
jgi:hypothetical protein